MIEPMYRSLFVLAVVLGASACETPAAPESPPVNLIHEMGIIEYGLSDIPMEQDEAARIARLDREMETLDHLYASTEGVMRSDWQAAADAMRRVVETTEGLSREKLEQRVAAAMLRVWLDVETPTPDQQAAAADYTRTLVRHRSPESGLVLRGMDVSGAVLTDDERTSLAAQTLAALAEREERFGEPCRGCGMPQIAVLLEENGPPTDRLRQIASAIQVQ